MKRIPGFPPDPPPGGRDEIRIAVVVAGTAPDAGGGVVALSIFGGGTPWGGSPCLSLMDARDAKTTLRKILYPLWLWANIRFQRT